MLILGQECVDILSNKIASGGGIWPVDVFPFRKLDVPFVAGVLRAYCQSVRHLPMWFPGAGFKRKAMQWRAKMEEFVDKPYELVKERMVSGFHCFRATAVELTRDYRGKALWFPASSRPSSRTSVTRKARLLTLNATSTSGGPLTLCILPAWTP